jgi:hypothetical protein
MLPNINAYIEADLTHSIHTSGSKSFRGCRRRWSWLTQELYYPKVTVKPLEFGVAFHKAMEVLYDPELWNKPEDVVLQLAIVTFFRICDAQFNKYEEAFGAADPEVLADYRERKWLGRGMLENCVKTGRRKDKENGFRPILVEVKFEIPIIDPYETIPDNDTIQAILEQKAQAVDDILWCKCTNCWDRYARHCVGKDYYRQAYLDWKGLPVTYGGRIDCVVEGPDGRVWIVDWKTAAQLSVDQEEFLLLDDQITRYCYALRSLGYNIAGFLYHELKKAFPIEPEPMTRRRLGRLFSVNKDIDTTAEIYERTVRELDPEAYGDGLYKEFIEQLKERNEHFYHRFQIYRNERELDQSGKVIWDEASDQVDPDLKIYPNPGRFNCQNCAFRQPCLEANSQGDVAYTLATLFDKKEYHYWEQEPMSTDRRATGV